MLAKLRQLVECVHEYINLMYNIFEMLGKLMKTMVPSKSAVYGNSLQLLPIRTLYPLMWMGVRRREWTSSNLSCIRHTRHLNPANHPSSGSPYSEVGL
jgi:hypothetical protein